MSDTEGENDNIPRLPVAVNRIFLGVAFGSTIVAIFFVAWALWLYGVGPVIGIFVFELIALSMILALAVNVVIRGIRGI